MEQNNDGGSEARIVDYSEGGRTEMVIHNGITHNKAFWKDSFVDNIKTIPTPEFNDIYGAVSKSDRLTEFKKCLGYKNLYRDKVDVDEGYINGGESGITSYGYAIIGGAPDEKSSQLSNTIADSIDDLFGTYVKFVAFEEDGPISDPIVIGDSSGIAKYEIRKNIGNYFIEESTKTYIYLQNGKKTIYACCTYDSPNNNPTLNEHGQIDTEGGPVIVKITTDDKVNTAVETIKVMYPYTNAEGEIVNFNKTFKPKEDGLNKNNRTGVINILNYVFRKCLVSGVKDYRIKYEDTTENEFEWEQKIESSTKATSWSIYDSYFAVGIIEGINSNTKLYKIYPNPVRIVDPGEEDLEKLKLKIDPTEIILPYVGKSRAKVAVSSFRKTDWSASTECNWITININDKRTEATIIVEVNKGKQREETVLFYYPEDGTDGPETIKLKVIQTEYGILIENGSSLLDYTLDFSSNSAQELSLDNSCTFSGICKISNWVPELGSQQNLKIENIATLTCEFSYNGDMTVDPKVTLQCLVSINGAEIPKSETFSVSTNSPYTYNLGATETTVTKENEGEEVEVNISIKVTFADVYNDNYKDAKLLISIS